MWLCAFLHLAMLFHCLYKTESVGFVSALFLRKHFLDSVFQRNDEKKTFNSTQNVRHSGESRNPVW